MILLLFIHLPLYIHGYNKYLISTFHRFCTGEIKKNKTHYVPLVISHSLIGPETDRQGEGSYNTEHHGIAHTVTASVALRRSTKDEFQCLESRHSVFSILNDLFKKYCFLIDPS
jgi:hypothetical protein